MFRELAALIPGGAPNLVQLHPSELSILLDVSWAKASIVNPTAPLPPPPLGHPDHRTDVQGAPAFALAAVGAVLGTNAAALFNAISRLSSLRWHHLIYAYMIENTRIYEIFRRVIHELTHGEKLGSPTLPSQIWLRATEELFYRDPPPFFATVVDSHIRSDMRASRRNAYQRMFGMDLNHGADDGTPYSYAKAEASNSDFVLTFEEFLREVWIGIIHVSATSASRPTDDAKIASLAERIHDMLITRRQHGNLSREEFAFVSMMSWFHLTVESNLPIVVDLKSEAAGAEQRLFRIAQRVGLPAHGLSKNYFDIADPMSRLLTQIEFGTYNSLKVAAVPALYTPNSSYPPGLPQPGPESDLRTIITNWTSITGRDVKAGKVAAT
jgi:hypothetical protein